MARIGFSQRRTIAYLYGWTLILAGLALALRFVPYTDDHGNFDPLWTVVMAACLLAAGIASFRLLAALEILKLLKVRNRQWRRRLGLAQIGEAPVDPEVEEGVLRELEPDLLGGRSGDRRVHRRGSGHRRDGSRGKAQSLASPPLRAVLEETRRGCCARRSCPRWGASLMRSFDIDITVGVRSCPLSP